MAATSKTHVAKAEKRVGADLAAQSSAVGSVDGTDAGLKQIGLAKALREEGIDERKIARGYANTHNKLGDSADKGDIKLFVEVLKENSRTLEATHAQDRRGAGDGPVTIIMRHNVPRPAR